MIAIILLYSHDQLYIHIYMQKHIQHNKDERRHFFRTIYLSLYWKDCVWEGVGDRTKTATYWPPNSSGYHSLSFLSPGLLNRGPLCWELVLSTVYYLQLTQSGVLRAPSAGCWFSLQHVISNWLELPVHRVILLFYAHSISSHNWPAEYATSAVFGMACMAGSGGQYTTISNNIHFDCLMFWWK